MSLIFYSTLHCWTPTLIFIRSLFFFAFKLQMLKIQDPLYAVEYWTVSCPKFAPDVSTKRVTDVVVVFSPRNAASVAWKVTRNVVVDESVTVLGVSHFVPVLVVSATSKKFLSIEEVERKISILSVSFISNFDLYSSL